MSRFNQAKPVNTAPVQTHTVATGRTGNNAAGFARDAKSELFLLAVGNFVGQNTFYEAAGARDHRFVQLIYAAVDQDAGWVQRFLPWLRNEANMRTASIVGAVEAARAMVDRKIPGGRQLVASVLQRADEPGEMLGYIKAQGYKLPKPIKRGIADAVQRLYKEFSLLKYDTASHAFRFGDVLELCHPDAKAPWQSALFKYALDRRHNRDDFDLSRLPMIAANAALRADVARGVTDALLDPDSLANAGMTWEDALSLGGKNVDKRKLWEAMIPSMGYMALLRNLRNFSEAGLGNGVESSSLLARVRDRIADPQEVAKSKQLPLRFLSAFNAAAGDLTWAHPLEQALQWSLQNVPEFPGRTLILIDTSGSMGSTFSKDGTLQYWDAAALFGLAVAARCTDPTVVSFSTASKLFPYSKSKSLLTQLQEFRRGYFYNGGTSTQAAVTQWFKGHDRVIILTDEQADMHGHYDVTAAVPKDKMVVTFNLAGYKFGHAAGGSDKRVTIGGLSDQAFKLLPILEQRAAGGWPF